LLARPHAGNLMLYAFTRHSLSACQSVVGRFSQKIDWILEMIRNVCDCCLHIERVDCTVHSSATVLVQPSILTYFTYTHAPRQ